MTWTIIILVFLVFLFVAIASSNKTKPPPEDLYSQAYQPSFDVDEFNEDSNVFFEVVGVHIPSRRRFILNNCALGDKVILEADPTNPHDSDAIKVMCHNRLIGYIKSYEIEDVNLFIEDEYVAKILTIDVDYRNYITVEISIKNL